MGEKKYFLESLMKKRIKRKTTNQKGREKEHKTKSFYICYISLTRVRARLRPRSPVGERSYGFAKLKPHPPKSLTFL